MGGAAALVLVALTLLHTVVFFVAGLPEDVAGWFALFQRSPVLGLLAFELLMVVYVVVCVPVVLALRTALRPASPALVDAYAALSLLGVAAFIAARPAFEMLALSRGAAASPSDAARFAAAGEVLLAGFRGTEFWTSYLLGSASGLLITVAMLRSGLFGRSAALLRIASSVLDLGLFVPVIGLYLSLLSALCLLAFNALIGRRLLALGRAPDAAVAARSGRHPLGDTYARAVARTACPAAAPGLT
jgi:hypothetical protein